ncbi:MAG: alkaline shock response membrane anchor protein AmaP [Anaerolineae bacterium]|nr:alkaline shock response membrane anchor protein AmaP [Anaerolineae bacterium]
MQSNARDMNTFNRVFVIVMLVALLVLGVFALVTPAGLLALMQTIANWFRGTVFASYSDTGRVLVRLILAILWAALIGLLLWWELRRSGSRTIELARYTGGSTIRISTEAVQEKVKEQVDAIPGVIESRVRATGRNRAVELSLDVSVTKDVDLVAKAEEIAAITRQVVQDQLGLKLSAKPEVAIKAKSGKAPAKPTPVHEQPAPSPAPTPLLAEEETPYLPPAAAEAEHHLPPPAPSSTVNGDAESQRPA